MKPEMNVAERRFPRAPMARWRGNNVEWLGVFALNFLPSRCFPLGLGLVWVCCRERGGGDVGGVGEWVPFPMLPVRSKVSLAPAIFLP